VCPGFHVGEYPVFQKYWWWANQMAQILPSIIIIRYYCLFGNFMERFKCCWFWFGNLQIKTKTKERFCFHGQWGPRTEERSPAIGADNWPSSARLGARKFGARNYAGRGAGRGGEGRGEGTNTNEPKCRKHRQACCAVAVAAAGRQRALDPSLGSVPSNE
jgi:hypothetical protein